MKKTFGLNKFFKHKNGIFSQLPQSVVDIDELIVHLDATNPTSYPGSGTTWTNLSRNAWSQVAGNASLMNGVSFVSSPAAEKGLSFDSNDDYVGITDTGNLFDFRPGVAGLNELTIEAWIKTTGPLPDPHVTWCGKPWNGNGEYNYYMRHNRLVSNTDRNNPRSLNFTSIDTKLWEHIAVVITPTQWGVYRNGVVDVPLTNHGITANSPTSGKSGLGGAPGIPLTIMSLYPGGWPNGGWDDGNLSPYGLLGKLAQFRLYRKALTAEQVAQNYEATKSRFVYDQFSAKDRLISSGLITLLDAEEYSGTGSTINDISENNNHGTIIGDISYSNPNEQTPKSFQFAWQSPNGSYIRQPQILSASNTYSMWVNYPDPINDYGNFWCSSPGHLAQILGKYWQGYSVHRYTWGKLTNSSGTMFDFGSGVALPINAWSNLTWSWNDTTKQIKFYLNGVLSTSAEWVNGRTYSGTISTTHPYNYIGFELPGGLTNYGAPTVNYHMQYLGKVANFFAYNRALSDAEVLQNYNSLKSRFGR